MPDITNILILKSLILLCKENRSILNAYVTKNFALMEKRPKDRIETGSKLLL